MVDIPIIRSVLFSRYAGVMFGMSTRRGGVSPEPYGMNTSFNVGDDPACVAENRERFLRTIGVSGESLAIPKQVHGRAVRVATASGTFESCDATVTQRNGVVLTVSVADCYPIFLFDPVTQSIAAVHAGWRGSAAGVAAKTIEVMRSEFGIVPSDVLAFIGPGAGVCCYEIGEEVAAKFNVRYCHRYNGGALHLDLCQVNVDALIAAGVQKENIEESGECTICTPEVLHSYRREGSHSGRMMGAIGLTPTGRRSP
jgi:YfiH family protein